MIALLLLLLAGCTAEDPATCSEEVPCGFGENCVDGQCQAQSCATSAQCGIEQYCDEEHACVAGCKTNDDCMFGDICNVENETCEPAECVDTRTDCGFGEFCAPTGECFDAGGYYCRPCEYDTDCGSDGNVCYGGYCGVECDSDADCPAGFDCLAFGDGAGNTTTHQCWTYCWLYEDED